MYLFSVLLLIGLYMIYSSSNVWAQAQYQDPYFYVKRQSLFALIGYVLFYGCTKISLRSIRPYLKYGYWLSVVLLILVLIPGIGVMRNGSRSWFSIGSFFVQPAEFFKLSILFYGADQLAKKHSITSFKKDLLPFASLTMIGFLLILLQPDFGSGMVMICAVVTLVFAINTPWRYFFRISILGGVGLLFLILSAPYRMRRILSFLDPFQDPLGAGFQMIQSLFAIGPGGLLGVGLQESMQKHFYLPEPQTDFIFAIFAEEFGFVGGIFLLLLFLAIIRQGFVIAVKSEDLYLCLCGVGLTALFAIQVMINLGVVTGLFPVTGITLPFLSYGGSSLLVMMASMGFLVSIGKEV